MVSLLLAVIYLAFISLGLPDSLLGSAWPVMHSELGVPVSWSGAVFMVISIMTVVSSLLSDRLTRRFGTQNVTVFSVFLTAVSLLGFSFAGNYYLLIVLAVPYGLGAGAIDAALNNYVAVHYKSRHMSWLHCMWGLGASISPYIMSLALTKTSLWSNGYRWVSFIQFGITFILILSLPLWKHESKPVIETPSVSEKSDKPLSLLQIIALPGAKSVMICFFCYSAIEQTCCLWASTYLVMVKGLPEVKAAGFASLFYIGITVGRAISGFITFKLNDEQMIRLGSGIILFGIVLVLLPLGNITAYAGLMMVGLGCAPIYPSIIHSTPAHFGADKSQAIIGVQMAAAYVGTSFMPPLFGVISGVTGLALLPGFIFIFLVLMVVFHEILCRKTAI